MTVWAQFFDEMERLFQIRSIHNELKIVVLLLENGPTASLDLHRASRRSISGYNGDLRRLRANGIVNCETGESDRREKIYDLEPDFRDRFVRFLEDYKTALANDLRPVLRRAPRARTKARSVPSYRSRRAAN